MRWTSRAFLTASILVGSTATLHAQGGVAEHRGLWFGAGVGMGSARLSCSICRSGRDGGGSGYIRVGATLTPQFLLGGETVLWYHSQGQVDYLLGSIQAVVYLYPIKKSGLYLKTGLGIAQYSAKDNNDKVSTQALAGQFGAGYEIQISRSMSIVPYANFLGTSGADVRFNDTVSNLSANTSLIQVGVGITLH
jgi:hypothetical protein